MKDVIELTKEQIDLLFEMLSLPQITVPFPKAKIAGDLYERIAELKAKIDS